jgi:hypothetical protein
MAKLEKIVIPVINFQDVSIEEAIDFLRMRSFELEAGEPESRGVSWIIKSRRSDAADSSAGGLEPVEPNQVPKINYSAKDVGLLTAISGVSPRSLTKRLAGDMTKGPSLCHVMICDFLG